MDVQGHKEWQASLQYIRTQLDESVRRWFEPLAFDSFDGRTLTLCVPNKLVPRRIEEDYLEELRAVIAAGFGTRVVLKYRIAPQEEEETAETSAQLPQEENKLDARLNPRYTFETFVEGKSNKLVLNVARSIAEQPGQSTFNPFFLFGASGVGKTHLANAVGMRLKELYPEKRVLYVTAAEFRQQYTAAVVQNKTVDFLAFYQSVEVLIIDDVQELDTQKTQQQFFHIFNNLQQNGRQIIMTCDRAPAQFEGIEERMLTRFKWGMVAELERPDVALREAILRAKTARDGLKIPRDVLHYIACHVESSVRELEGVINGLLASSIVEDCPINVELARRVVGRIVNIEQKRLAPEKIAEAVCRSVGVKMREVSSKSRKSTVVFARQVIMYLLWKYVGLSYAQIGRFCGNRDHSTAFYACTQVKQRIQADREYRHKVENIETTFSTCSANP
ncbi:MAG: chromosomal replication initiator protein DnaA [Prevotellaceae bacterium]|nr:chromosomal replication initiator protein DnaA [Prevotellaceae bacterium]